MRLGYRADSTTESPMTMDSAIGASVAEEVDRFVGRLGSALGDQWAPTARKWVARAPGH